MQTSLPTSKVHLKLKELLESGKEMYKHHTDQGCQAIPDLVIRDKVWLSMQNLRSACPLAKLDHQYLSSVTIQEPINLVAFKLQLPKSLSIHPVFHVSVLKPCT